jgi:hypothetical protein
VGVRIRIRRFIWRSYLGSGYLFFLHVRLCAVCGCACVCVCVSVSVSVSVSRNSNLHIHTHTHTHTHTQRRATQAKYSRTPLSVRHVGFLASPIVVQWTTGCRACDTHIAQCRSRSKVYRLFFVLPIGPYSFLLKRCFMRSKKLPSFGIASTPPGVSTSSKGCDKTKKIACKGKVTVLALTWQV